MTDYDVDDAANEMIDAVDALGLLKAAVVVFDPADPPEEHVIYSNAAAVQLLPVLKAMVARIEAGDLRMPVGNAARWVAVEAGGADHE
jgi:hypothetical protein